MEFMRERIFDYRSYKTYLKDFIRSSPGRGRGIKTLLANAAQCQSTYVSQVLQGERNFNLEQAELINIYLGHTHDEAKFFILLVSFERAGNSALRARMEAELNHEREKYRNLKDRLKARKEELSPEVQANYYRTWYNTAVHVCLTVANLRTKDAISRALGVPLIQVAEALEFLTSMGLAEKRGNEFFTGTNTAFIGRDSPFLTHHHINWRHQAIRSIELNQKDDVHYSSVVSVTTKEAEKIRELFLKCIEDAREIWKASKNEEALHSICVDVFKATRG